MTVTLRLYAGVREAAGTDEIRVAGRTIAQVRDAAAKACPPIANHLPYCRFAIQNAFVPLDTEVDDGTIIDAIPPVSGG
jgi:molybdopterin converting factor small subunit